MIGRIIVAIVLTMIFSGCATEPQIRYVIKPLPIPVRPALPRVLSDELMCLSDQTYQKLKERERERRQYSEELEVIIRSTHKQEVKD